MPGKFTVSKAAQHEYRLLGGSASQDAQSSARAALAKAKSARPPEAVHVTKRTTGWAIKVEGAERASSIQPTKAQAIAGARKTASSRGARVIEHTSDGRISKNTKPHAK